MITMETFDRYESEVRSYCRDFPTLFTTAQGYRLADAGGMEYIDFFSGAGALNYGHNDPKMKQGLIDYLERDGVVHSLDMSTDAKGRFLERFAEVILEPRELDFRVMFPGPTGTNAVESALKIARKATGRDTVVSFTNAFHGMTLGALAVTGNGFKRAGAGRPLDGTVFMPYDGYLGEGVDTLDYFEKALEDGGSGLDLPAAVIVETVQGEGGLNVASVEWLQRLQSICREHDILLIVDDIQAGCGRTGTFFSFEPAGIEPDLICLSKSIGGMGLPMALVLIRPDLDVFMPGEHNGTFRGNNLAFVTGRIALDFWKDEGIEALLAKKAEIITDELGRLIDEYPELDGALRGRGFMQGVAIPEEGLAAEICGNAFRKGVLVETAGSNSEVIKIFAPLIIDEDGIREGFELLHEAVADTLRDRRAEAEARGEGDDSSHDADPADGDGGDAGGSLAAA